MDTEFASRLEALERDKLGNPLDRSTFTLLVVTTLVLPVVALLIGWGWLG